MYRILVAHKGSYCITFFLSINNKNSLPHCSICSILQQIFAIHTIVRVNELLWVVFQSSDMAFTYSSSLLLIANTKCFGLQIM